MLPDTRHYSSLGVEKRALLYDIAQDLAPLDRLRDERKERYRCRFELFVVVDGVFEGRL